MNRRHFVMGAAGALASTQVKSHMLASPNDTVRVACVGVRGQGRAHLNQYSQMKNVEIAAICDIDESILNSRLDMVEKKTGKKPASYWEIRKLLEDKSIDAISIATPNHSHTLQTIWSLQAGKHVYCEKPCSHDVFESKQIVAATKKYGKIVQHGTNSRSGVAIRDAIQKMNEGLIGDVYHARGLCFKWRDTIGRAPVEPVPAGVHYDQWLGPAPKHEFTKNRFHYNWHWFWDYGNGDFGNQGIHELDIARWGLGVSYPHKVSAIGGHYMFDDDQETPNTLSVSYEFREGGKNKLMTFEVRHWATNFEDQIGVNHKGDSGSVGNIFYGSKGYLCIEWYTKYWTYLFDTKTKERHAGPTEDQGGNNWENFIEAVRANDPAKRNAPIEEGAKSATLMHLGNISYRLGRSLTFDAEKMECVGDREANAMFKRKYRSPYVVPDSV
ncbi:MAG TPA: Gfo/Idh/MocA family oxidoreductase [Bryobacteraceae bacterium]